MLQNRKGAVAVIVWDVQVWWDVPVIVQSMTNTPTRDVFATTMQIKELAMAGSEIVRITVNDDRAAEAVPKIVKNLRDVWITVAIVWDFHYNGHILLNKFPELAANLDKYFLKSFFAFHSLIIIQVSSKCFTYHCIFITFSRIYFSSRFNPSVSKIVSWMSL